MAERSMGPLQYKTPSPRNVGMLILLLVVIIVLWGTFVIVPAGHRGVCLWWGSVEKRIMGEGLNFKVPIAEKVIKVDVKVQPHPFKEIDASSKEYQMVKMTGNDELPHRSGLCQRPLPEGGARLRRQGDRPGFQ